MLLLQLYIWQGRYYLMTSTQLITVHQSPTAGGLIELPIDIIHQILAGRIRPEFRVRQCSVTGEYIALNNNQSSTVVPGFYERIRHNPSMHNSYAAMMWVPGVMALPDSSEYVYYANQSFWFKKNKHSYYDENLGWFVNKESFINCTAVCAVLGIRDYPNNMIPLPGDNYGCSKLKTDHGYTRCHETQCYYPPDQMQNSRVCKESWKKHFLTTNSAYRWSDYVAPFDTDIVERLNLTNKWKKTPALGIELELTCLGNRDMFEAAAETTIDVLGKDFVILKHDGSVEPGFEIVTVPETYKTHKQKWIKFFECIPKNLVATDSCGVHIHINKKYLSKLDIIKFHKFINAPHNEDFIRKIAGRYNKRYANFIQYSWNDYKKFNPGDASRYQAVNLVNPYTIELRIFKGTTDITTFLRYLEFTVASLLFIKATSVQNLDHVDFRKFLNTTQVREFSTLKNYVWH